MLLQLCPNALGIVTDRSPFSLPQDVCFLWLSLWSANAKGSTLSLEHMQGSTYLCCSQLLSCQTYSFVLPLFQMPSCHCRFTDKLQRDNPFHKDTAMKWTQLGVHTVEVCFCSWWSLALALQKYVLCSSWSLVSMPWKRIFYSWSLVLTLLSVFSVVYEVWCSYCGSVFSVVHDVWCSCCGSVFSVINEAWCPCCGSVFSTVEVWYSHCWVSFL